MNEHEFHYCDEKIAVVIPMFRVDSKIQAVVDSIPSEVDLIICVDDASPDKSADSISEMNDSRIHLIKHTTNQGVGGATISGFQKALESGATIIVKMDGDGQMASEYIHDLIKPIRMGEVDFAKGNRFVERKSIFMMPFIRRMGNLALSFIIKASSGYWNLFDPTNGFIAIDAQMLKKIDQDNLHKRYFFECSLLGELNRNRAVVKDIPMPAKYADEISSLSVSKTLFEFPPLLLSAWVRRILWQYYTVDFSAGSIYLLSGFLLTLFGLIWGIVWWSNSIRTGNVTSTGTVMISVLPIILGVQLLLQFFTQDIQSVPEKPINARRFNTNQR